jgi:hypothetical protein
MSRNLAFGLLIAIMPLAAATAQSDKAAATRSVDLATMVSGVWRGDVTADVRGSSRSGVTITVARIAPNRVRISSDYNRIPSVEVDLEMVGQSIMNAKPGITFLIQQARDPNRLDLYIDQAALIVRR